MARRRQKLSYKIRQAVQGPVIAALVRCIGLFPLSFNRRLGFCLGNLLWRFQSRAAHIAADNIRRCFPALAFTEQQSLARASVCNSVATLIEATSIWTQNPRRTQPYLLEHSEIQLCREKMSRGRGLLLVVPHLGNWEMFGSYLPGFFPISFMFQPSGMPQLDKIIYRGRSAEGMTMVPTNTKGVAALLKALKRGECVGILPDQVPDFGSGEIVPFFAQSAYTMTLVHKLLQRTQCEIVIGYCKRVAKGYALKFAPLPEDIYSPDSKTSLTALNRGIETCIQEATEQYQWTYKRFKLPSQLRRQSEGEQSS